MAAAPRSEEHSWELRCGVVPLLALCQAEVVLDS